MGALLKRRGRLVRSLGAMSLAMGSLALTGAALAASPSPGPAAVAPVMELLDPGQPPREPLRYALRAGTAETLVMEMTQSISDAVDDEPATAVSVYTIRATFTVSVTDVDPDGSATWSMQLTDMRAVPGRGDDPDTTEAIDEVLAQLVGFQVTSVMDARGFARVIDSSIPPGLDPAVSGQLDQLMGQASQLGVQLPEEAVGAGARWSTTASAELAGIPFTARLETVLVDRDGSLVRLETMGTQHGTPEGVTLPDAPEGFTTTLESLEGTVSSDTVFNLTRLVPTATSRGTVTVVIRASDGRTEQVGTTIVETRARVRPGASPEP